MCGGFVAFVRRTTDNTHLCVCRVAAMTPARARMPKEPPLGPEGGIFAGFVPLFELGRGSYGAVYLLQNAEGLKAVDKRVKLDNLSEKEKECAIQEIELLRQLDHPYITRYRHSFHSFPLIEGPGLWSGRHHELLHIIMDYCDGGTVEDAIRERKDMRTPHDADSVRQWMCQCMCALAHLHAQKILHRDVKPANIFLIERIDGSGRMDAQLGDFGISRVLGADTALANTAVGTPYYMSPEVVSGMGYDGRSDVWSLGCICYELITLVRPFQAASIGALAFAIAGKNPTPLPADPATADLASFVELCLQKDPQARPTAHDLLRTGSVREGAASAGCSELLPALDAPPPLGAASTRRSSVGQGDFKKTFRSPTRLHDELRQMREAAANQAAEPTSLVGLEEPIRAQPRAESGVEGEAANETTRETTAAGTDTRWDVRGLWDRPESVSLEAALSPSVEEQLSAALTISSLEGVVSLAKEGATAEAQTDLLMTADVAAAAEQAAAEEAAAEADAAEVEAAAAEAEAAIAAAEAAEAEAVAAAHAAIEAKEAAKAEKALWRSRALPRPAPVSLGDDELDGAGEELTAGRRPLGPKSELLCGVGDDSPFVAYNKTGAWTTPPGPATPAEEREEGNTPREAQYFAGMTVQGAGSLAAIDVAAAFAATSETQRAANAAAAAAAAAHRRAEMSAKGIRIGPNHPATQSPPALLPAAPAARVTSTQRVRFDERALW